MTFDSYELLLLGDGKIPTRVRSGTVISHLHVQRRIIFFWDRVACQSAASDVWTRTRRKRTGEEEGSRGPRSRREVERGGQSVISSWRGAGPDGIALSVSCLSRHVSWPALPGIASATSMTRSFPVLVPIHASEVAPGLGCPRRHRVSRDPRPVSLVLTSSLPPSLSLSFFPLLPFLFEAVDVGRSEKSRENSARSSCATRLYNRFVSNDGYKRNLLGEGLLKDYTTFFPLSIFDWTCLYWKEGCQLTVLKLAGEILPLFVIEGLKGSFKGWIWTSFKDYSVINYNIGDKQIG